MLYNDLIKNLENKTPFSLSRWGDGEWLSVFNTELNHYAADHTLYYPEIGIELRKILESEPKYHMGMQPLAMREMGHNIEKIIADKNINWIDSDILHNESWSGNLQPFFDALKLNNVIYVGPERLKDVKKLIDYKDYVEIPLTTAFLDRDKIEDELRWLLLDREHTVVLFAAASLSNYLIDKLYKDYGDKHTFIDIGSLMEPYVGLSTRQYHKDVLAKQNGGQQ